MNQKAIIFDASTIISFSMNGLLEELRGLKKNFGEGKFLITEDVKKEIIERPLEIKKFQLEALRTKQLFDEKVIEMPNSLGINKEEIEKRCHKILELANSSFIGNGKEIHLIDRGEASCIALSQILNERKIKNVLAIDERTARMLIEKPENLRKLLEKKLHVGIKIKKDNLKIFREFKIIRSIELMYIAYKKKIFNINQPGILEALLYGLKLNGASVSEMEINEIKNL